MAPCRRAGDAHGDDHTRERDGNGLDVGGKGLHVRATGPLAILAMLFLVMVGVLGYLNFRIERTTYQGFEATRHLLGQAVTDHSKLTTSQDLLACVVSLSPEERTMARRQGDRRGFASLCPWLRSDP